MYVIRIVFQSAWTVRTILISRKFFFAKIAPRTVDTKAEQYVPTRTVNRTG